MGAMGLLAELTLGRDSLQSHSLYLEGQPKSLNMGMRSLRRCGQGGRGCRRRWFTLGFAAVLTHCKQPEQCVQSILAS